MYKFRYIYEKEYPDGELKTLGIQISETCVVSTRMFSRTYPVYDASIRGIEEYSHRLVVLTEKEMNILRERYEEFNAMLRACHAHFLMPTEGVCLQRKTNEDMLGETVDFVSNKPVQAEYGWTLYKYLW